MRKQYTPDDELARQARQMQESCAVLFEYLERRDRKLMAALARIPSESDVEVGSVFNVYSWLETSLRNLDPGVAQLTRQR